ncbi:hypothetical protein Cst_c05170 [Thermoclostridium stercorarium subsp. stercorarium DSM 8532]|jgi:uncharacterized protein YsxB (DUF464 family)|uniref:Ribosomal processing cysteine protease Prp n=3 Tax=Thermoclostridium stercorarium TaxID=1510 RepID=L7VLM4_THES1|nr:ribosomal-processing cysteine protease Prp [Thermoclostridium stercorarium]AGC67539.1 hypothetical protein Cst_c05170 [Thermoclostridium stercorarium subsp. stercorarium DSM 8532]AGI38588.1 ribosomal protein [Thermoclostridium stercorarium subsp. stercorarium DSM 8532]ANW97963.1 hypothetical protein CSTERTH_02360 [Thermoclostridium stercorarium subsp. thermolacticum DSM 2910]ANX00513.1 hypothetical protein CSTERLE_02350 [Thermoclostridium stercorarium subsp. leptospartum DSM 9219]
MIKAVIYHNKDGKIKGFKVKGHAGFGTAGNDIVCAAVSAVVYTALGGLDELAGFRNFVERDGYMECHVPDGLNETESYIADIILKTMVIGLRQIEADYSEYIQLRFKEV